MRDGTAAGAALWLALAAPAAAFGDAAAFEAAARARGLPEAVVQANAARMRAAGIPPRGLVVNIPAFEAYLLEDGAVAATWKVMVGSAATPTPELASRVDAVVLNPEWAVPHGEPARRVWSALRADPTHFETHGMTLTVRSGGAGVPAPASAWADPGDARFRVIQAPGPTNPLGRVLFRFANPYGVWLHDTPERALFARPRRALTLGCVRIERPTGLAARLLADRGWTRAGLEAAARTGRTRVLALEEPLELRFVYWTAWLEDGRLRLAPDIYGRDAPGAPAGSRGPAPSGRPDRSGSWPDPG